jgi:hypothetical protein
LDELITARDGCYQEYGKITVENTYGVPVEAIIEYVAVYGRGIGEIGKCACDF